MNAYTKQTLIIALVSVIVSFAIYGNGVRAEFTYDDGPGIQTRQDLKDPRNIFRLFVSPYYFQQPEIGLYRPLPMASYLLNYSLFGSSPVSFHIVNILLHALSAFLVYKLIQLLFSRRDLSLLTFLLFLFHPIHTEAVSLIVGRAELFAFIFSLGFLYLHLTKKYLWAAICFLASLLSKEIAVMTLPLLFFIKRRADLKPLGYVAMLFIYLSLRYLALGPYIFYTKALDFVENPLPFVSISERVLTAFKVLTLYIEKLIYPIELSNDYSYNVIPIVKNPFGSWESLLGIGIVIGILVLVIHPKTRSTPLGLGALLFFLPYFLISNFVLMIGTIMAERLVYFSSFGFALIVAYLFTFLQSPKLRRVLICVILILYGWRTITRNEEWLSNDALYAVNLKNHPEGFLTQLYWGTALVGKNQIEDAKKHLAQAQDIYPNNPKLITTLGAIAQEEGNTTQAERYYKEAISKYNLAIEAYSRLGYLSFTQQKYEEAADNLLKAIRLYPNPSDVSYYARTQIQLKHPEIGIETIHRYFGYNPEDIEIVSALGYSYYIKEDYQTALPYLLKAQSLGNVNPEVAEMITISQSMLKNPRSPF
ncbi:tetratricopeptide repeat protein [Candidatus Gottesmanbacteria bacterium]|nr:tetratricopeptide repeat protein [Candidatus Gottesmanbacteria bacterium]